MEDEKYEENNNQNNNNEALSSLKADLDNLRRELEEEKNRHLRTRADFDNFRKRTDRDTEVNRINIKKDILLDLLTFLDYFDQARKQVRDPAAAEGIEIIARQFNEFLYKHGARPVQCLGQPFDPEEQEGIGYIVTDRYPEGCVAEEICAGWKLGDTLLKPARVMVAKEKSENNMADSEQSDSDDSNME